MTGAIIPPPWTSEALCAEVDPELFFPEKGGSSREAKLICRKCPVQAACLSYALSNEEHYGIWGGTSERERRKVTSRSYAPDCQHEGCMRPVDKYDRKSELCSTHRKWKYRADLRAKLRRSVPQEAAQAS